MAKKEKKLGEAFLRRSYGLVALRGEVKRRLCIPIWVFVDQGSSAHVGGKRSPSGMVISVKGSCVVLRQ